ncbi:MAG TPA: hypothetical protein VMV31_09140 [Terriglobales bacterium]|nr:hypothetical protein [Terriglobales bacterium]
MRYAMVGLLLGLGLAAQTAPANFPITVQAAVAHDTSLPLARLMAQAPPPAAFAPGIGRGAGRGGRAMARRVPPPPPPPVAPPPVGAAAAAIEQTSPGSRPAARLLARFDGLGNGFRGPQGTARLRNPSDNSLAVGPSQVIQTVNSQFAIFDKSGRALEGPVPTRVVFDGFQGECGAVGFGDVVVRYDQLAQRWVWVMPIFRKPAGSGPQTPYGMCYAVSQTSDPLGRYYRYDFARVLFPDYPRLGVWPDGYYLGTSTGDTVIQKHACVAERAAMLAGREASEQCAIVDGVNFLNPADVDGRAAPPAGAPELVFAAGGTQLHKIFDAASIHYYRFHVDWAQPAHSRLRGPYRIAVAPYHYLCNGQLTSCVPQPGTNRRLDAQGDKIMQRVVYRRLGERQSILVAHSVNTRGGGGGVRWYEFRLDAGGAPRLYQQGTYAPGGGFRWMGSLGMDRKGDIAMGYSYGDGFDFAGQRLTGRLAGDAKGHMTLRETVLASGGAAQTSTLRWEDYTTLAMDPSDDCTFWYVGDYLKPGAAGYSTKIGAWRLPGCR